MRLARIRAEGGPAVVLQVAGEWREIEDAFAAEPVETGRRWPVEGAHLLAPVEPRVILGMAHNGSAADRQLPPQAFHKTAHTLAGPGDPIVLDEGIGPVVVEGELALVIGRTARHLTPEDALAHVLGATVANDVTAPGMIAADGLFLQGKNGDGWTPLGPWIETGVDVDAVGITVSVDGEVRAVSSTDRLGWRAAEILVHLTSHLTLHPGDVVLTGSPGTAVEVGPGQEVLIALDGIGALASRTVAGPPRAAPPQP
ncbi:fumarylacetoacetate hydrolase [Rathayibacter sp. AY2B3]|jgi:2-keto-4-pentenoate hydratase/2-oxohepta-3-ene-1,7-dioic acid hydratase in catechol pathway|uniref:fumarylacetoacetate hydrolase family protein n=1 Tax=Rathayibacter sp. AY2B3 TaxID=2080569 RepID=UPI000CE764A7|nr:fumarylacetoacetate hydrolase family protein [Rathayibacter sp. AY2B3]PPG53518.1 fumarylacetoacetate hydrolase [Rathayibacter sp. AY2B3]